MERKVPQTLVDLAENNTRQKWRFEIDGSQDPLAQSNDFFRNRFSGRIHALKDGEIIQKRNPFLIENPDSIDRMMYEILNHDVGMLLVRPEMYHNADQFSSFLEANDFQPIYTADKQIDIAAYEDMYGDSIPVEQARPSMPTRTMVYTDSPCKLILFRDPKERYKGALADNFIEEFKGKEGVPTANTLRGEVVYNEAKRLGYDKLDDPVIAQVLDPFGVYRELVQTDNPVHVHLPDEDKLLKYVGVGVHVPNLSEIFNDLPLICPPEELTEILTHLRYPYIDEYNRLWKEGKITKPIVALIGGYAGTGKSTLAEILKQRIGPTTHLPTGEVRAILKTVYPPSQFPYLYKHTYDLGELEPETQYADQDPIYENFDAQVEPVAGAISQVIDFASSEKQHHIIDGNHVMPGRIEHPEDAIVIEFYLQVSNQDTHRRMLGGETHNRILTEEQFRQGRKLHDYIVEQARNYNKPVFDFKDGYEGMLELLNNRLQQELHPEDCNFAICDLARPNLAY